MLRGIYRVIRCFGLPCEFQKRNVRNSTSSFFLVKTIPLITNKNFGLDNNFWRPVVTISTTSLTFNNCTFCPHCIYLFCIYLRTNSDLCHLQHKLTGFCNPDGVCLLRGTDWLFIYIINPLNFSGHYTYFTVVTICTTQWSLYAPPV